VILFVKTKHSELNIRPLSDLF